MLRDTLVQRDASFDLDAPSLAEANDLCEGEPFADQPSAAVCSGLLVDADLVLTAGHCARMLPCAEMRIVTGFFYREDGELARPSDDDVHECAEVLASERSCCRSRASA
jgi:hypothetical protein